MVPSQNFVVRMQHSKLLDRVRKSSQKAATKCFRSQADVDICFFGRVQRPCFWEVVEREEIPLRISLILSFG